MNNPKHNIVIFQIMEFIFFRGGGVANEKLKSVTMVTKYIKNKLFSVF